MDASLIINGHEIREYIAEDGIQMSQDVRCEKSITTKNGTIYKRNIIKNKLKINLLDNIIGKKFTEFITYLSTNPATVSFTDYSTGTTVSGTYYIENLDYSINKSYGDDVLISGASFSLLQQ